MNLFIHRKGPLKLVNLPYVIYLTQNILSLLHAVLKQISFNS